MSFKAIQNQQTGATEYSFFGTLQSIGAKEMKTKQGKGYFIGAIAFKNPQGNPEVATCFINAKNYAHGMETGKSYMSTLSFDDAGNPTIRMSHLVGAERATKSMFAGLTGDAVVETVEEVEEK
jgi:hypothetical protein